MSGYIGVQPVPQATQRREYFTATSGQTTFNTNGYTPNYIDVYMNGVKLSPADFTASNGSDVVLASGAATGDLIQVVSFTPFNVANQTFIGDVNLSSGAYKIGGNTVINSSRAITATGLTVDGNTLFNVDTGGYLAVSGNEGQDAKLVIQSDQGDNSQDITTLIQKEGGDFTIATQNGVDRINIGATTGDISFYDGSGNAKFFWDASFEGVGIGTTTMSRKLNIRGDQGIRLFNDATNSYLDIDHGTDGAIIKQSVTTKDILFRGGTASGELVFETGGSEHMRISGGVVNIKNTGSTANFVSETGTSFVVGNGTGAHAMTIYSGTGSNGSIYFADGNSGNATYRGGIQYLHGSDAMRFNTAANNAVMTLDSSGNLLVGTTSTHVTLASTSSEDGFAIGADSYSTIANDGRCLVLNRRSSDGNLLELNKNGVTVGSIGNVGNNVYYSGGSNLTYSTGLLMKGASASNTRVIVPADDSGTELDTQVSLGRNVSRFKDLFLSGGVYLGGTGAANKLDDYEEGTWTPVINGGSSNPSSPVYGEQLGSYTKVGNTVTVNCVVKINSLSSNGSGSVEIGGLPFSGKTQTSIYQPAAINIEGINTALTSDSIIGLIPSSSSTFYIYRNNAGTGGMAQITWGTYWIAGSRLRFNMTYFTN